MKEAAAAADDAVPALFAEIAAGAGAVAVGTAVAVVGGCMSPVVAVVGVAEIDVVADEAESSAAADIVAVAAAA